jgi:uncharacterized protein (AIM24 family)
MIAMSPTTTLKGSVRITLKRLLAGAHITHSTFTGPGEVLLAPPMLGDITPVMLSAGSKEWNVGKDAFLACTQGVTKELKRQGLGKALFSGEGLFVYKMGGVGVMWITSFGAIVRKDVCGFFLVLRLCYVTLRCAACLTCIFSSFRRLS